MQEIAERETPGAGSGQLQVIRTPDTARDRRSITVEVGGRLENISLAEMEFYCDLFEEMFDEFDRREPNGVGDLEGFLDEFDRAEIEHLRLRYGTPGKFFNHHVMPGGPSGPMGGNRF